MAANSVPAFFGSKTAIVTTAKPVAMDVTFLYSNSTGNTDYINAVRTASNIAAFNNQLTAASIGASTAVNRYSMSSFEYDMHSIYVPPYTPYSASVVEFTLYTSDFISGTRESTIVLSSRLNARTNPFNINVPGGTIVQLSGTGTLPSTPSGPLPSKLFLVYAGEKPNGFAYLMYNKTWNDVQGTVSLANFQPYRLITTGSGSFTVNDSGPAPATVKTWLTADETATYEWADARNVAATGANDKDETGAIYYLASSNRSHQTLVTSPRTNWPRTTDSWPSGQTPSGPVVDGVYRSTSSGFERVLISHSLGEAGSDVAIAGTYGIANGAVGTDYNLDNQGTSSVDDNNTDFIELDSLMGDNRYKQRLIFIDTETVSCSGTAGFITAGTIPSGYSEIGVLFLSNLYSTVVYGPADLSTASLSDVQVVSNVLTSTITAAGIDDGWGAEDKTHTGHYALRTNGGVFSQSRLNENLPLAFQILGKAIGTYLYS